MKKIAILMLLMVLSSAVSVYACPFHGKSGKAAPEAESSEA